EWNSAFARWIAARLPYKPNTHTTAALPCIRSSGVRATRPRLLWCSGPPRPSQHNPDAMAMYCLCFRAAHLVDEGTSIVWQIVCSPGDVSVRPYQNQTALVELYDFRLTHRDSLKRHLASRGCQFKLGNIG